MSDGSTKGTQTRRASKSSKKQRANTKEPLIISDDDNEGPPPTQSKTRPSASKTPKRTKTPGPPRSSQPTKDDANAQRAASLKEQLEIMKASLDEIEAKGDFGMEKVRFDTVRAGVEEMENAWSVNGIDGYVHGALLDMIRPAYRKLVHDNYKQNVVASD
jgi:hypothetical protein